MKTKVLKLLDKPKTATTISNTLKKHRSAISTILLSLEKRGFAVCLNPRDNMSRFYQITDRGKEALSRLKDFE